MELRTPPRPFPIINSITKPGTKPTVAKAETNLRIKLRRKLIKETKISELFIHFLSPLGVANSTDMMPQSRNEPGK
jgi:hypothetical protein